MLDEVMSKDNSRNTVFDDGVHIEVTDDLACGEKRHKSLASRLRNGSRGRIWPFWPAWCSKSSAQRAGDVVVDDCASSASGPG